MSNCMSDIAFVAYSSQNEDLKRIIFEATRLTNSHPLQIKFTPWEFNDIAGSPLISPIVNKIDASPFIVADITYLNLNVIYEIGYAIGRSKRVFLIRNRGVDGDKSLASKAGIFDTLGYHQYYNETDLSDRLTAHIDTTPIPINFQLNRKSQIYSVEPPARGLAEKVLLSRLRKAGYSYIRTFNPDEDLRMSATDAIRQVAESSGIAVPLQNPSTNDAELQNIRAMFVLGLADGMSKPRLAIAPVGYSAPLDVRDTIRSYRQDSDIAEAVADFCPQIVEYSTQIDVAEIPSSTNLQSLDVGDPRAENEMTTLGLYYLRTHEYERALAGEVNLVVGRKGSGKTALWISVRDKTRSDKRNIVVDLKPEGYQLIKFKEDILVHLTEGAREHLITAFWEYLILLEVAYKLLEKDKNSYRHNHDIYDLYVSLEDAYRAPDFTSEGDFAERLSRLSERIIQEYRRVFGKEINQKLNAAQVTQLIHSHDLRDLRQKISAYLQHKKSVWILFDNLDRGWNTQGFDALDAIVLRCLVDAGRKLEREMRREDHVFHCIVFVRNDVYDHLMRHSTDYGKELRAVLDWSDPDLLREMFRLRLVAALETSEDTSFDEFWRDICVPHYKGEETSTFMIERSLMRPRNFLKIFSHCKGFAINFRHARIEEKDINKGIKAYSDDLLQELDRELSDVHPEAKDLLYYFLDSKSKISRDGLRELISSSGIQDDSIEKIIQFLLYYGVVGINSNGSDYFIYNVNYDPKMLNMRMQRDNESNYIINPAFWPSLNISVSSEEIVSRSEYE